MSHPLHPHLDVAEFNSLFQVPAGLSEEVNIGKQAVYKTPCCIIEHFVFVVGSLQYNFAGNVCYRLYTEGDEFGRCASPEEVTIL